MSQANTGMPMPGGAPMGQPMPAAQQVPAAAPLKPANPVMAIVTVVAGLVFAIGGGLVFWQKAWAMHELHTKDEFSRQVYQTFMEEPTVTSLLLVMLAMVVGVVCYIGIAWVMTMIAGTAKMGITRVVASGAIWFVIAAAVAVVASVITMSSGDSDTAQTMQNVFLLAHLAFVVWMVILAVKANKASVPPASVGRVVIAIVVGLILFVIAAVFFMLFLTLGILGG